MVPSQFSDDKCLIWHESLSLKFHAILLAISGDNGFVSVVVESRESRVVLVKINEMALKVPSQQHNNS